MYGICQNSEQCERKATHQVQFGGQPRDPMRVCGKHAKKHGRKPQNTVKKLV